MAKARRAPLLLIPGLLGALAIGGLVLALRAGEALPQGPAEIVWDREACAHCRMHIGERAYAAQLQLKDGRVLSFDDPGCLLKQLAGQDPAEVHAIYLHHKEKEQWLTASEVAFTSNEKSPMGFGLGAVEKGRGGTLSFEEAFKQVNPKSEALRWP